MMEKFAIAEVYGMHNLPGLDLGKFATRSGPIMASTDEFRVTVRGRGGHAAMPHTTIDPVVIAAQIITAVQTIASRNVDPLQSSVVSVTILKAGDASNVIPDEVSFAGTIRTLNAEMRELSKKRLKEISEGVAAALGAQATVSIHTGYPVTKNHGEQTGVALNAAGDVAGLPNIDPDVNPMMGGEDFSYMLNARPGNFIFIGNGNTASLHNADYDFNDDVIPHGVSYWVRLAEQRLSTLAV
jgi:amidohydrolase